MLNKKQSFEQIERTIYWNTVRGNTPDTLNYQLEIDMLTLNKQLLPMLDEVIAQADPDNYELEIIK